MLVGQDLVDFVISHQELSQKEQAREAGYVRVTKAGKEQVLIKDFTSALLQAKGLPVSKNKTMGKPAQFETTVHQTGIILLGKHYSRKFGVEPGDVLTIKVTDDQIVLLPKIDTVASKAKV